MTLSSGATTTTASGAFTFAGVAAGSYTVTISGFSSGVSFPSTTQAAVVTAGGTATVSFAGSEIKNSIIAVTVAGSTGPLASVNVSISGAGTGTKVTDATGVVSFTGLAAGSYTVTISGTPAGQMCSVTSQSTSVPAGETRSLSFTCVSSMTASITGRMFLDENDKNNLDDGTLLEDNLAAANVVIQLEGPTIGVTQTTQTDANGDFSFTELSDGQYNVRIDSDDTDIPDNVEFGLASETVGPIILAAGGTAAANFPFDIIGQTLNVFVFVGTDDDEPGIGPVEGATIDLYPTAEDVTASTNLLASEVTDETGAATFEFDRADDTSPQGGTDNIVFADFISVPGPLDLGADTEDPMEVAYDPRSEVAMAPDTFDVLNRKVTMAIDVLGATGSMDALEGWRVIMFRNDTVAPFDADEVTDEDGRVIFERTVAAANLPDTFFFRLATAQAAAGTHSFSADNEAGMGVEAGRWLMLEHDGLYGVGDTTVVGDVSVTFDDVDIVVRIHHENDDTVGLTGGDNFGGSTLVEATLTYVDDDGDEVETMLTPAAGAGGEVTFLNIPTNSDPYTLALESQHDSLIVLGEDEFTLGSGTLGDLSGGSIETTICVVGATDDEDECSVAGLKWTNGLVRGNITDVSGTVFAEDVPVRVSAYPGTIEPNPLDTIVTVNAAGAYKAVTTEGMYIVEVMDLIDGDGDTIWTFEGQRVDTVDVEGRNAIADTDYIAIRADTEIHGVVVNDRDNDNNTVDAGEALEGVMMRLYRDNSGTPTVDTDSLVAEMETDANGGYIFDGLREGIYIVKAVQPSNAIVLTGLVGGTPVDTQIVNTTAIPPTSDAADQDGRSRVGNLIPRPGLPRFDYDLSVTEDPDPSHFTYLLSTGIAQGTVKDGAGDGVGGVTVTIRRCQTSAGSTNPPSSGSCAATYDSSFGAASAITDGNGGFTFSNLREGVYEVRPTGFPAGFTDANPDSRLYLIDTPADTETGNFTVVP